MKKHCLSFMIIYCSIVIIILTSCPDPNAADRIISAPEDLRLAALSYAEQYLNLGATYLWGGQDPLPRTLQVDCSGLIVRCYEYACEDLGYTMPFDDMTAAGMQDFCGEVEPEPGDLIFMGDGGVVSHVAIFVRADDTDIYFIDSTDLTGGVSQRFYPIESDKFISFGRLRVYSD